MELKIYFKNKINFSVFINLYFYFFFSLNLLKKKYKNSILKNKFKQIKFRKHIEIRETERVVGLKILLYICRDR